MKRIHIQNVHHLIGHHQLVRVDYESREEVDTKYTDKILDYMRENMDEIECIVVSDYDKGIMTTSLIKELINLKKEKGKKIIVDPKIKHFLDYKGVSIIRVHDVKASKMVMDMTWAMKEPNSFLHL